MIRIVVCFFSLELHGTEHIGKPVYFVGEPLHHFLVFALAPGLIVAESTIRLCPSTPATLRVWSTNNQIRVGICQTVEHGVVSITDRSFQSYLGRSSGNRRDNLPSQLQMIVSLFAHLAKLALSSAILISILARELGTHRYVRTRAYRESSLSGP